MSALRLAPRAFMLFTRPSMVARPAMTMTGFMRFQSTSAPDKIITETPPAKLYTYPEVKKLTLNPDPSKILVDVREPEEVKLYGTIPTALNIPFKSTPGALDLPEEDFEDLFGFDKPSKDKELVFFCQAGLRSAAAEELVGTFGYTNRGNYSGSFNDWYENESNLKASKSEKKE